MSTYEVQAPIIRLGCDHEGCDAEFEASTSFDRRDSHRTRIKAGMHGWDVPPPRGKGSRRGTDFCPDHKGETR